MTSAFLEAPVLRGNHVELELLAPEHEAELSEAVREGELWRLWVTRIPSPDGMAAEIRRRLAEHEAGTMVPWAVRDARTGRAVGMTTYMNVRPDNRRLEIGSTWLAVSAQRTAVNPEVKLLLLTRAFEVLDCVAVEFRTHWPTAGPAVPSRLSAPSRTVSCATRTSGRTARSATWSSTPSSTPSGRRFGSGCASGCARMPAADRLER